MYQVSRINWIAENLTIINKRGSLIKLEPNDGQLMLSKALNTQRSLGLPIRIVLLKPRQVGWSTWSEAEAFYHVNTFENTTALVVSADTDSTDSVFNMTRLFQDQMPPQLKRKTVASNRKEIVYAAPHRSKFWTQTAGKDVLGRGGTCNFLHCSEVAFWPKAEEGLAAVLQQVPELDNTVVILESTANGLGGAFYNRFVQAVERGKKDPTDFTGFLPVFFPWYKFDEYKTVSVPEGFKLDEEEKEIVANHGLSNEQMLWRRLKIQALGGDYNMFRQEYPSTWEEAFVSSGNPVFTAEIMNYQANRTIKEPRRVVFLGGDEVEDVNRAFNAWQIYRFPQSGHAYSMGIDTKEDKISDPDDANSELDRDAVVIFDRTSGEVSAIFEGRLQQSELGLQCLYAASFYNDAYVAPEIPKGLNVLKVFTEHGYENLYNRQIHDERLITSDSENLGWRTTMITRKWMVDSLLTALRDGIYVRFEEIVSQMRTFIYDKSGKPIHYSGEHDDLLFALMIAVQVHLRCPIEIPYEFEHTGEPVKRHKSADDLAYSGAIDDLSDLEEDEVEEYSL